MAWMMSGEAVASMVAPAVAGSGCADVCVYRCGNSVPNVAAFGCVVVMKLATSDVLSAEKPIQYKPGCNVISEMDSICPPVPGEAIAPVVTSRVPGALAVPSSS